MILSFPLIFAGNSLPLKGLMVVVKARNWSAWRTCCGPKS